MRLKFRYKNWRGDDHEYVIELDANLCTRLLVFQPPLHEDPHICLSGNIITRDGDPRIEEMGGNRRRSFVLSSMRDIEEIR